MPSDRSLRISAIARCSFSSSISTPSPPTRHPNGRSPPKNCPVRRLFGAASLQAIDNALDALVADRKTEFGAHVLRDGSIAHALRSEPSYLGDRALLVLVLDQHAIPADPPPERSVAA